MNAGNPRRQLALVVAPLPQLANPGQAARDQAKAAARAPSRRVAADIGRCPPAEHFPVDIVRRAIEIDHRARRMGDKQHGTGRLRHFSCQSIDIAILQPERGIAGIAHAFEQRAGITATGVGHGNQDGYRRGQWTGQGERVRTRRARYLPPGSPMRIACCGTRFFHSPLLDCPALCVKVGQGQKQSRFLTPVALITIVLRAQGAFGRETGEGNDSHSASRRRGRHARLSGPCA